MNNTTIVIQGRLNEISLKVLEYYKTIGDVVISCWDTDNLDPLKNIDMNNVVLIKNKINPEAHDANHVWSEAKTSYEGIIKLDNEVVIKTRSDESFTNLQPMLDKMYSQKDKIICGSPHFKPARVSPYCAGWRLWGCKKTTAETALQSLLYSLENGYPKTNNAISEFDIEVTTGDSFEGPEKYFTKSFLYTLGERDFTASKSNELIKKHFDIIRFAELGDLTYTCNTTSSTTRGSRFFKAGEFTNGVDEHQYMDSLDDMDSLDEM